MPFLEKIDIFQALQDFFGIYEPYVVDATLRELEGLAKRNDKKARAARIALLLIKQKNLKIAAIYELESSKYADDSILKFVSKHRDFVVATLDKELINALKEHGIKVLMFNKSKKQFMWG